MFEISWISRSSFCCCFGVVFAHHLGVLHGHGNQFSFSFWNIQQFKLVLFDIMVYEKELNPISKEIITESLGSNKTNPNLWVGYLESGWWGVVAYGWKTVCFYWILKLLTHIHDTKAAFRCQHHIRTGSTLLHIWPWKDLSN